MALLAGTNNGVFRTALETTEGAEQLLESGRTMRMRSGSICSTSPMTVAASVSCPWPDDVVWMVAVT